MSINKYSYQIDWSEEDQCFIARALEFPSLSAFGNTRSEAQNELDFVVDQTIKWMGDEGEKIPKPLSEKEYKGNIALRVPPETHRAVAFLAQREGISINQFLTSLIEKNLYADRITSIITDAEYRINASCESYANLVSAHSALLKSTQTILQKTDLQSGLESGSRYSANACLTMPQHISV